MARKKGSFVKGAVFVFCIPFYFLSACVPQNSWGFNSLKAPKFPQLEYIQIP